MTLPRRLTALALSIALPLASVSLRPEIAAAAPPAEGEGEDDAPDPEIQAASDMFYTGVTRYNAADYEGAIELWLTAYDLVEPTFDNRLIKAEIIYNVARAQQKWFEIDDDVEHLRRSRVILDRYLGEIEDLYGEQSGLEREKIEEQIAAVEAMITDWEAEQARREAELAERMRPKFDEEADAREARRNKAMIGAGAGLTTVGLGGVGLLVTGIILAGSANEDSASFPLAEDIRDREGVIARGNTGNALLVTGSLAAGVFLAAGVPLLIAGAGAEKKRRARRADAGVDEARFDRGALVWTPLWLRGGAGLGLSGRF